MKKILILMGSPRLKGNTAEILKPFMQELKSGGCEVEYITLADKNILPCKGCYTCQNVSGELGCVLNDDATDILGKIINSDCIVFATPIYSWFCTAPMKALLDRHYALNKFYGKAARESLWEGKRVAIISTHGYGEEYAVEPFQLAIQRLCKHSGLEYIGKYCARDNENLKSFQTFEAIEGAVEFARKIMKL